MLRPIAIAALLAPALFAQEQLIDWRTNYREALSEAKASHKPLFVEFRCEA
jgi:hypothetical protein